MLASTYVHHTCTFWIGLTDKAAGETICLKKSLLLLCLVVMKWRSSWCLQSSCQYRNQKKYSVLHIFLKCKIIIITVCFMDNKDHALLLNNLHSQPWLQKTWMTLFAFTPKMHFAWKTTLPRFVFIQISILSFPSHIWYNRSIWNLNYFEYLLGVLLTLFWALRPWKRSLETRPSIW